VQEKNIPASLPQFCSFQQRTLNFGGQFLALICFDQVQTATRLSAPGPSIAW